MINEIITMKKQGMSFRKIADKLNSTVGKVHYQWIKFQKEKRESDVNTHEDNEANNKLKPLINKDHYLVSWVVENGRLVSCWKIASWQKELVSAYFNGKINNSIIILRLYDVTDIIFNGSNAHHYYEFQILNGKTYWLIKGIKPNRNYLTEIGFCVNHEQYFPILRSNATYEDAHAQNQCTSIKLNQLYKEQPEWSRNVSSYTYYETIND